jgi:hypothetical protein
MVTISTQQNLPQMIVPGRMALDSLDNKDFVVLEAVIWQSADPLPFQAGKWQGQADVQDLMATGHSNKEDQPDKVKSSQKETNY